jgi:hypothetical protein
MAKLAREITSWQDDAGSLVFELRKPAAPGELLAHVVDKRKTDQARPPSLWVNRGAAREAEEIRAKELVELYQRAGWDLVFSPVRTDEK